MALFKLGNVFSAAKQDPSPAVSDEADIKNARDYVSTMSDVFQTGAEQQKIAMQRVNSLSKTITKMEAKMRLLTRVEGENKALTDRVTTLEKTLSHKAGQAIELENDLSVARLQLKKAQEELLSLRTENTVRKDRDIQSDSQIQEQETEITAMATAITTLEDRQMELSCLNSTLQKDLSVAVNDLSARNRTVLELQKSLDEARTKMETFRKSADANMIQIGQVKANYETLNTKFIETDAMRETAQYEATLSKAEFEGRLKRRDEQVLGLKNRIQQFEAQVRIKEGARIQAERDIAELQHQVSMANARADTSDSRVREKTAESDVNADNALKAKSEFEAVNAKYLAALEDIAMLKKLNQVQKDKLMRYAAVDGRGAVDGYMPPVDHAELPIEASDSEAQATRNVTIFQSLKSVS